MVVVVVGSLDGGVVVGDGAGDGGGDGGGDGVGDVMDMMAPPNSATTAANGVYA